jgi:hypothetical protein
MLYKSSWMNLLTSNSSEARSTVQGLSDLVMSAVTPQVAVQLRLFYRSSLSKVERMIMPRLKPRIVGFFQ